MTPPWQLNRGLDLGRHPKAEEEILSSVEFSCGCECRRHHGWLLGWVGKVTAEECSACWRSHHKAMAEPCDCSWQRRDEYLHKILLSTAMSVQGPAGARGRVGRSSSACWTLACQDLHWMDARLSVLWMGFWKSCRCKGVGRFSLDGAVSCSSYFYYRVLVIDALASSSTQ